jgi:hypothetical protein
MQNPQDKLIDLLSKDKVIPVRLLALFYQLNPNIQQL